MADVLNEKDDDEIVIVETDGETPKEETPPAAEAEDEDDADDDSEEERMGVSEDDSESDIVDKTARNRDSRQKRRQIQKAAKERAQRELALLRQQNSELMKRMAALEGNTLSQNAAAVASQYQMAVNEARQAEAIMAKAVEAGNGEDVAVAIRLRDEANQRAQALAAQYHRVEAAAKQAVQPKTDPRVQTYAQQWLSANPWYDPSARDEDSAITKAIDDAMAREGWNPAEPDYWHELTRRVSARLNPAGSAPANDEPRGGKRKAPPTGNTREHAPVSTKNEVVVTAERKQAMIDAGVWDDPVARKRYLKAYQEYDRNSAR